MNWLPRPTSLSTEIPPPWPPPAVLLHQGAGDGQSQAGSALLPALTFHLLELAEDALPLVRRDPRSFVDDAALESGPHLAERDRHGFAGRRELDGVAEQVGDDLVHAVAVAEHVGQRLGAVNGQLDLEAVGVGLDGAHAALH